MTGVFVSDTKHEKTSLWESLWDYATRGEVADDQVYEAAWQALLQALINAFSALREPEIQRALGPKKRGATLPGGSRVLGTAYELDQLDAASNLALLFTGGRDLEQSVEWGMPWDSWGAVLAVADALDRPRVSDPKTMPGVSVHDLLTHFIKSFTIQTQLVQQELCSPAEAVVISTAVTTHCLLGGDEESLLNRLRHQIDKQSANQPQRLFLAKPMDIAAANRRGVDLATQLQTTPSVSAGANGDQDIFQSPITIAWRCELPMVGVAGLKHTVENLYKVTLDFLSPTVCESLKKRFAKPSQNYQQPVHEFMAFLVSSLS